MNYKLFLIGSLYLSSNCFLISSENNGPFTVLVHGQGGQEQNDQQTAQQRLSQCCNRIRYRPDGTSRCTMNLCIASTLLTVLAGGMLIICQKGDCSGNTWFS